MLLVPFPFEIYFNIVSWILNPFFFLVFFTCVLEMLCLMLSLSAILIFTVQQVFLIRICVIEARYGQDSSNCVSNTATENPKETYCSIMFVSCSLAF